MNFFCKRSLLIALPAEIFSQLVVRLHSLRKIKKLATTQNISHILLSFVLIGSEAALGAGLPTGGKVEAGQVSIAQTTTTMNVTQTTQRAVVSWNSFDVAKGNAVNFVQPNASAVTLNRVNGVTPSMINGAINANGQVIFVNPNGVVFGKGSEVNVGAMVATTMNVSNADFMAGKDQLTFSGGDTGKVVNKGRITVSDAKGFVALMAPEVRNEGVILANISGANSIALVSGKQVTLTFADRQMISISVDASVVNSLITNKRLIQVNGGQVVIAANAANNLMSSVVTNKGTVAADGVNVQGGVVTLTAGAVTQAGTVSANSSVTTPTISSNASSAATSITNSTSSTNAGVGGKITIAGDQVTLASNSKTTATGALGGGRILLGINAIDRNQSTITAKTVTAAAGSVVDVSATQSGNGGVISVWSSQLTNLAGQLLAKGGQLAGNGGSIQTGSLGSVSLASTLSVDTSALAGNSGNWVIASSGLSLDAATTSVISNALSNSNVTIQSGINIPDDINNSQFGRIVFLAGADINNVNPLTSLNLNAANIIEVNSNIQSSNTNIQAGIIQINPDGSLGNNGNGPSHLFLAGAAINILGSINGSAKNQNLNNQSLGYVNTNGGTIWVVATDNLYIGSKASIIANGEIGGLIHLVSTHGSVIVENALIQTNGSTGRGGTIEISGLLSTNLVSANIQAQGNTVGGIIKIGNDAQYGTLPFSLYTSIDANSTVNAFAVNGPGGYIETSGHTLHLLSAINAGRGGIWLLDPTDIVITSDPDGNIDTSFNFSNPFTLTTDTLLSAVSGSSTSYINVNTLTTALNLGQSITISTVGSVGSGDGDITVSSPISANDGSLTLNAFRNVNINAAITLSGLTSEVYFKGATINLGGNVTTGASQRYDGPVLITQSKYTSNQTTLSSTNGGFIVFGSTVDDGDGVANNLVLSAAFPGGVSFTSGVGLNTPLASLTVNGDSLYTNGVISTVGAQQYNVANFLLGGNTEIRTVDSPVSFNSINDTTDGIGANVKHDLTINAGTSNITFNNSIGDQNPIKNLYVFSSASFAQDVITVGNQYYAKPVTTIGSVQFFSSSIIKFDSTIDDQLGAGQSDLVIRAQGGIALGGDLGSTTAFKSITVDGPVQLTNSLALNTLDGPIHFKSTIDSSQDPAALPSNLTLNAGTGTITLDGSLGVNYLLGALEFNSPVVLGKTATCLSRPCGLVIATADKPITFNSTFDDASTLADRHDLTLSAGISQVNLFGALGSSSPFNSLNIFGTANLASSVSTTGDQTYNNTVLLLQPVTMNTVTGNIEFKANVMGNAASVTPQDLIQFLGNGDYLYNSIQYTADANARSNGQIATVTYDSAAGTYLWTPSITDIYKVMAVAGGGAGGGSGGGGGGGGVLYKPRASLIQGDSYLISVGAGGFFDSTQWPGSQGSNGQNSQFATFIAIGGGGGGGCCWGGGNNGGSGGGSSVQWYNWGWNGFPGTSGLGTAGQGTPGSSATWVNGQYWMGGGGGGAASSPVIPVSGQNVSTPVSGNGGNGLASNITGTSVYYGGGGGASPFYEWGSNPGLVQAVGGLGGGGAGGYITGSPGDQGNSANWVAGTAGLANTGGGGGAGPSIWYGNGPGAGSGGSGTVVVARPTYGQATDLTINSGTGRIIGVENISNINNLSLSSSSGTPMAVPLNLVANSTSFTKGGTDTYTINGLASYGHTITVNGGTLAIVNSPGNSLFIDSLVLRGGALALDSVNQQDLSLNNLTSYLNSPITNVNTLSVSGLTTLGSSVTSAGDQYYAGDVTLVSDTTLTSTSGNVVFGGSVTGFVSSFQFLGGGQYIYNGVTGSITSPVNLDSTFTLTYSNGQYGFSSAYAGQTQVLVVAGGGAGGVGGGGGGGVIYNPNVNINAGSVYAIKIGAGGLVSDNQGYPGGQGGNSQFGNLEAIGGGAGNAPYDRNGGCCWRVQSVNLGGSGGGGGYEWGAIAKGADGTNGQGFAGGTGSLVYNPIDGRTSWQGGGGGGAGGSPVFTPYASNPWGQPNVTTSTSAGYGGVGFRSNITGTALYYGGGGGGGNNGSEMYYNSTTNQWIYQPVALGGLGGGGNGSYRVDGNGSWVQATAGAPNTGGGGGGSVWCCIDNSRSGGGSGIVALNVGIAPSLTINAQPSSNYPAFLQGTNFSKIGLLTVNTSGNFSLDAANQIASSAGIVKMGSGVLTLNNITSYTGSINVSGGTVVTPGLTGPLSMGSLYLANGGTFDLDTPQGQDLNLGSFTMVNGGSLLHINSLNVSGLANLSGTISTSGSQTYGGSVIISSDTTIQTANNNPITFNSTINDITSGVHNLVLNSGLTNSGLVTINGAVGSVNPLNSLTINGPGSIGSSITTAGDQTFNGDVRLIANTNLNTVTGNININGNVLGDAYYPGVIQLLGQGWYSYQTLGIDNNTPYALYHIGVDTAPAGLTISYTPVVDPVTHAVDPINGLYTWTANYSRDIQILLVAGGGAGGAGGGGGGGGVLYNSQYSATANQQYGISVGAGGVTTNISNGQAGANGGGNGGNSSFNGTLIAYGGGGGGGPYINNYANCCWYSGFDGGSGGGGSRDNWNISGGAGTPGQGYAGGSTTYLYNAANTGYQGWLGGGGGGAGGSPTFIRVPGNPWNQVTATTDSSGSNGGPGLASSITGSLVYYGGGGGGSNNGLQIASNQWPVTGIGGVGGGGNGAYIRGGQWVSPTAGAANTGGGGGAGNWCCSNDNPNTMGGGSGIAILSVPVAHGKASLYLSSVSGTANITGNLMHVNEFGYTINSSTPSTITSAQIADTLKLLKDGTGTLSITGVTSFNKSVSLLNGTLNLEGTGAAVNLNSLTVPHGATLSVTNSAGMTVSGFSSIGGSVTSDHDQTYSGAVTITGDAVLTAANNGYVTFASAANDSHFDSNNLGVDALVVNGNFSAQSIGTPVLNSYGVREQAIGSISVSGNSKLAGNISTNGSQTFNDIQLKGDVTLTNYSGDIQFGILTQDTSGRSFTLDTPSNKVIEFSQISGISGFVKSGLNTVTLNHVGNYSSGSITVNAGILHLYQSGSTITVDNFIVGNSLLGTGASVDLDAGGQVNLTVGGLFTLDLNSSIYKLNSLTVAGNAVLRSDLTTAGNQSFNSTDVNQSVRVGANLVITSQTGNVHFAGGVSEYSNQTNYLKLLGNGEYLYSIGGVVTSGVVSNTPANIADLQMGISYANGQYSISNTALNAVSILIVGGGGAGGAGGGGGGGGINTVSTLLLPSTTYSAVVGNGGVTTNTINGQAGANGGGNGQNSQFADLIALGGGGGGGPYINNYANCCWYSGYAGGSGGGGSRDNWNAVGGSGTPGQGFAGGSTTYLYNAANTGYQGWLGGGGGGAGGSPTFTQVAGNPWGQINATTDPSGSNGGSGLASTITGSLVYYAGGGGGSTNGMQIASNQWPITGLGGIGGGGNGATIRNGQWVSPTAGTANTGGGGGAGNWCCSNDSPNTMGGGSGVVIVRQLSNLTINVGLGSSSGALSVDPSGSFAIGSLTINSNNNFSLNTSQIANSTLFTKGGSGTLALSGVNSSNASSIALIVNGGSVKAAQNSAINLAMNSLTINNGSTFDMRSSINSSLVDLSINSLFMNSNANLLGLNSLVVNQLASLSGTLETVGSQTYNGAILLTGDTTLHTTGSGSPLTVNASIDDGRTGNSNLVLNVDSALARSTLNGAIGAKQAIGSLTVNGLSTIGTTINTVGNQTYNNDITLTNIQSSLNDVSMSAVTGNITFNGAVTGYRNTILSFLGDGNYSINGITYNTLTNPALGINLTYSSSTGSYSWNNSDTGSVQLLLVAGGGAGGAGGGGGGGGVLSYDSTNLQSITPGVITVVVGAGGVTSNLSNNEPGANGGGNGGDTKFASLTAIGGGGGGGPYTNSYANCCWQPSSSNGYAGGSGGGASINGWDLVGGSGAPGQGYAGGSPTYLYNAANNGYQGWLGGGGGGAGGSPTFTQVAGNPWSRAIATTDPSGSNGGPGLASSISGSLAYYGGGGGGSTNGMQIASNQWPVNGIGGIGGGGNGATMRNGQWISPTAGAANTGGGGGAGYWCCSRDTPNAMAGGSGVVILNGTLAAFSRANLSLSTGTGLISFGSGASLNNIGALSISTNRMSGQTLSTGIVTNTNTTSLVKGGSGVVTISGLSSYSHPVTVTGGVLSLINSPSNTLYIDTLVLHGGSLALDLVNPQDLTVNNLTTYSNSPIASAKTVTVTGSAYLGSEISSIGDQHYNNDVILWADTTLTSANGNVIFGGNVIGFSAQLQFLGNGQYQFNKGNVANANTYTELGGGLSLTYSNGQYAFGTQFLGQAEILLVGGGGAGGADGGGGGGGVVYNPRINLDAGSIYSVIVGAGGVTTNISNGQPGANGGGNGGDTSFGQSLVAYGGGGGGGPYTNNYANCCWVGGHPGASGGGGTRDSWNSPGGTGIAGQGYAGGQGTLVFNASNSGYNYWQAGGGGGAGGSPVFTTAPNNPWGQVNATTSNSTANGGPGLANSITGTSVYYGGGGGGSNNGGQIGPNQWALAGAGGIGGGGNSAYYSGPNPASGIQANTWIAPTAGAANTGGGGGGGVWCCSTNTPNTMGGGSGIIVLNIQNTPGLTLNVLNGGAHPIGTSTQFVSLGTLTVNSNTNFTLDSARLAGTQGFIKGGSSDFTLTNPNSYSGFVGVSGGKMFVPDDGSHIVRLSFLKILGGIFNLVTPQDLVLGGLTIPSSGNLINVVNMTVNGQANIGGTIATVGSQTYNGPVVITSDVVIETQNNSPISFNSTIDDAVAGTHNLTLYPTLTPNGLVTISGNVGSINPLKSLTVNSPSSIGGATNAAIVGIAGDTSISTTGSQIYNGDVRLIGNTSLNTVTGNIYINGNVLGDKTYGTALEFLGQGNYRYQGVQYLADSGTYPTSPVTITVSYDANSDTYTWFAPYDATISALIVGGGGAGGLGGGGGGGVLYYSGLAVNNGQGYTVIVGSGGLNAANSSYWTGQSGGNSQFASYVAIGGGGGAGPVDPTGNCPSGCWLSGLPGGSGGGGSVDWNRKGGAGTPGQGYAGATSTLVWTYNSSNNFQCCYNYWQAGGGGGAGGSPANFTLASSPDFNNQYGNPWNQPTVALTGISGNGGPGVASNISGAVTFYGGGGGGGVDGGQVGPNKWAPGSIGGIGGGGGGAYFTGPNPAPGLPAYSWMNGTSGLANTGGGGGGGLWCCNNTGSGGSGTVILSVPIAHGASNLSLNSGTGKYFINGSLSNINTLSLASNSTGTVSGSSGMQWSDHAVTIDATIFAGVQNFTKNGVDAITLNNLRPNFGQVTVNSGNLYIPTNAAVNGNQFSFDGINVASGANLYLNDLNTLNIGNSNLSLSAGGHLYLDNVANLNVAGTSFLGNSLDITGSQNQTYSGAVRLGGDIVLSTSGGMTFGSTIDSAPNTAFGLEVTAPNGIVFSNAIGSNAPLAYLTVNGPAQIPSAVNTIGNQIYKSSLTLFPESGQTTTLNATGANSKIYLLDAVDGNSLKGQSLTVNANKAVYVIGNIGYGHNIDALNVTAQKIYLFADVYTGNSQTYTGDIYIGGGTDVVSAIGPTLSSGISGVNNSFLASLFSSTFNYSEGRQNSHITARGPAYIRTLISRDPSVTFNGAVSDYGNGVHTLLVGAISDNWAYPTITLNGCLGCNNRPLYAVNMQTMYSYSPYSTWGNVNFNSNNVFTISDQTYRTDSMSSYARNYQPIIESPPGRLTAILPSGQVFNQTNYGITNGSIPGFVKILIKPPPTLSNPSSQGTVVVNGNPVPQSSFSSGGGFTAPSSGSTSSGGSSSGGSSSSGSSSGGSSSGGSSSGGSSSGGSTNAGSSSGGNSGSSSSSSSSSTSSSSGSSSSTSSSSTSSSGGATIPPVKVVEANTPAPVKSGSSLGGISLGGLMASLGSTKASDSLPTLAGDRAPLGIAVVDVGGIEVDDPTIDLKKKK